MITLLFFRVISSPPPTTTVLILVTEPKKNLDLSFQTGFEPEYFQKSDPKPG